MAVCGLSLHLGSSESRQTLEQKLIFQIGTYNPHGINERFHSTIYFCFFVTIFALYFLHIDTHTTHNSSIRSDEGLKLETTALKLFTVANLRYQLS